MVVFVVFAVLALAIPLLVALRLTKAARRTNRRAATLRIVGITALAGAIGITPVAFLFALGAYAGLSFFVEAWLAGVVIGGIFAGLVLRVRRTTR